MRNDVETDKVYVETHALIAWDSLPPAVREDIFKMAEEIAGTPPENWPPRIRPWRPKDNIYVIPAWLGGHELLTFIFVKDGRVHIDGLKTREAIEDIRGAKVRELA